MTVESDRVSGDEPDVLAVREDDGGSKVSGLVEGVECVDDGTEESSRRLGLLEGSKVFSSSGDLGEPVLLLDVGDEGPDDGGAGEEDRGEEGRVVVTEDTDEGSRCEGSGRSSDLVHDVDDGVHLTELLDVSSDDVTGDNTTDLGMRRSARERIDGGIDDVRAQPFHRRHH